MTANGWLQFVAFFAVLLLLMRPLGLYIARVVEGEADNALDALARVDVFLRGELVGCAELEDAAHVHVNAFGVLTNDREIDVAGRGILQRAE